MAKRIIVAGGGTGGHLFPGIAVGQELRARLGADLLFVGTARGIEARVLPARGEALRLLEVSPLKGRSPGELLRSVGRLPGAALEARRIVREHDTDLVIGVGGYASGPVLAAAASLGIPTAVLEQNAHVGLTNRMVAPLVGRAYVSFEETAERFGARARVLGNPIRPALAKVARRAAVDPDGFEARANTILVLGGSQGAGALNELVPAALAGVERGAMRVVHQTGAAMREEVQARYDALGVAADVVSFIDDMAGAYASAALVVARAGATTLAEVCAIGRPSVLVPYPHAADDHQTRNARALEIEGAAVCLPQEEMDARLQPVLRELLADPAKRRAMSDAARRRGRPDAAAAIVDDLCEWLGWSSSAVAGDDAERMEPEDGDDDLSVKRGRLRGFGSYQPALVGRRSTLPAAPQRALVFSGAQGWK